MGLFVSVGCTAQAAAPSTNKTANSPTQVNTASSPARPEKTATDLPIVPPSSTPQGSPSTGDQANISDARIPIHSPTSQEDILKIAQKHLADTLGVSIESVSTEGIEAAEWNDLALGCEKPNPKYQGRSLSQSIPGYRILLSSDKTIYEYHTGGEWMVFCGVAKVGSGDK